MFSMFDDLFKDDSDHFMNHQVLKRKGSAAVNVLEDENGFTLDLVAPGYKKDDFKISLDKDLLTIGAEFEETKDDSNTEKLIRREYHKTSFKRSFTLPESVNSDAIDANYSDGILKVRLPKKEVAEQSNRRDITIR